MDNLAEGTASGGANFQAENQAGPPPFDATSSPVVKLVDSTLHDALRAGASDVHLECVPAGMVIKHRIDGVLDALPVTHGLPDYLDWVGAETCARQPTSP